MHVGFVIAGGIETGSGGFYYDRRLRARLEARGHEVTVVSIPWRSYGGQLLESARCVGRLREQAFDVLLEDGLAHPSVVGANRLLETPVVALVHILRTKAANRRYRPFVRAIERRFLAGVDAVIYNSEATRHAAESLTRAATSTVVPPAGDRFPSEMTDAEIRRRAERGSLSVLFLGTITPRKGLETLVEGLSRLAFDWRLTVVGETTADPGYVESVRERARKLSAPDRIQFTGRLPDSAVRNRLRETHVLAVPSQYEPFGMAYLEAMAFGCVPIATTNGGAGEFIEDDRSGFVIPPKDPDAVADRLERMRDRDVLTRMGIEARRAFEAQPTWAETLDRAVDFIEKQCPT